MTEQRAEQMDALKAHPQQPPLVRWRGMKDAPRDGTWVVLDVEDGAADCAEYPMSSVYVGRWAPKVFPEIGPHSYEWELIDRYPDEPFNDGNITTHYVDGRVRGWLPMPGID